MQHYSYKDPLSFNHLTLDDLHTAKSNGVYLRGDSEYESWIRRAPRFLDDPDRCGLFPPFVDLTFKYRRPFIVSKPNVTVTGVRTFLDQQGNWFNDQSYPEDELNQDLAKIAQHQNAFLNEWTGFHPTSHSKTFTFNKQHRMDVTLRGRTLVACSIEPDNYGSWLFRVLPKLDTARNLGLQFDRILIEGRHKRLQDYLDLMGLDRSLIVQHDRNLIYHLEHALIPSLQNPHAYLEKDTQKFYLNMRARYGLPSKGEKIYISRSNHTRIGGSTRILQNEYELIDCLSKEGFKIICPELLSLKEQIETFSSAGLVVGPSGSAMFNAVFCHPRTKLVDIESEPHWIHAHTSLFTSLDLDYSIFVGRIDPKDPTPVHKKWFVNIPELISRIRSLTW